MRQPVLHVIPFLWSGAGNVLTRLCEHQRRQGPVILVTGGARDPHGDWLRYRRRLRRAGVTHHTIDFFHRREDLFWSGASRLAQLMRDVRPAVIHAHAGVPACAAAVARTIAGQRPRLIGQMYSWGPQRPEWMNVQDMWGFAQTDRVVCSARGYWDLLVRYGVPRRKLVYLPWGLPLDQLTPGAPAGARTNVGTDDGPLIGYVGRIEPRKGQRDLVEAFVHVRKRYPQARLELVGPVADAAYANQIAETIAQAGLGDRVTLTGEVRDPFRRVRGWDLFVSLSDDEGQGLAVLEAMALGVPVAARPVAGISDYLADGRTGFAITGSGATAAARVIVRAITSPALRTRAVRAARRLIERRYSWDRTVEAFDRLYWR